MRHASEVLTGEAPASIEGELVLDYDARQKPRFRAKLASGEEITVQLPRGTRLSDGDTLRVSDGKFVRVRAAAESLSVVTTSDPHLLARVAYHLGNRHVALAIAPGRLAYGHDHVLDDMVRRLGAKVSLEHAPFVPEGGAYGGAASHHHHGHGGHEHDGNHAHHHHAHHHHDSADHAHHDPSPPERGHRHDHE